MLLIKLILARITYSIAGFTLPDREYFSLRRGFPDQERKIPGNHEMSEVFLARKKHYQCHPGFPAENGDRSLIFLTVYLDADHFSSLANTQSARRDKILSPSGL
jgi:hypothetical protein